MKDDVMEKYNDRESHFKGMSRLRRLIHFLTRPLVFLEKRGTSFYKIQLFVRTMDLVPWEPPKIVMLNVDFPRYGDMEQFNVFIDNADDLEVFDSFKLFEEDILANGIKNALLVDCDGNIADGNARYWIARKNNIDYVPVNMSRYHFKRSYVKREIIPARLLDFVYSDDERSFCLDEHRKSGI